MVLSMPWIVVALIAYNFIVFFFGAPPPADPAEIFKTEFFAVPMPSGATWTFTLGDIVMIVALIALFVEVIKATQTRTLAIVDQGLSTLVFIICLIEFMILPQAASSLFFAITMIALIDVVAGFSVGRKAAPRSVTSGE